MILGYLEICFKNSYFKWRKIHVNLLKVFVKFVLKSIAICVGIFASFYLSAFFFCLPFCENSASTCILWRISDMLCRFYRHDVVKTFETLSPSRIFLSSPGRQTPQKSVMPCHWLCQLRNFSHKIQVFDFRNMYHF